MLGKVVVAHTATMPTTYSNFRGGNGIAIDPTNTPVNVSWIQLRSAIENTRIERRLAAIVLSFFQSDQRRQAHDSPRTA